MKYHLIGDQGVSMRGLKKYLEYLGHDVTGSDLKTSGHKKENVEKDTEIVVRTSAVTPGSPGWVEVEAANELGVPVIKRSQLVKDLTKGKRLIAVAGMHGKTTITAMTGLVLDAAGYDPTVLVGDEVRELDNDVIRIGHSEWFVLEACEYDRSFLDFYPEFTILSNIEIEHLDTYPGGLPEIIDAYAQFIKNMPENGVIFAFAGDENVKKAIELSGTNAKIIFYGEGSERYGDLGFALAIPGKHNIQNALAVVALADYLGIDPGIASSVLSNFQGAHRRFEKIGNYNGADLIDDYGHHPTEIRVTIEALSLRYPDKQKRVVFWPHQYKRILPLLEQFGTAFAGADEVIVKPIFFVPGRDEELPVSSEDLVAKINLALGREVAKYFATDEEIVAYLQTSLDDKSVLLTIGIPPVYKISKKLLGQDE
jgi:UDP-N-acetylmuramate--alanine ligase